MFLRAIALGSLPLVLLACGDSAGEKPDLAAAGGSCTAARFLIDDDCVTSDPVTESGCPSSWSEVGELDGSMESCSCAGTIVLVDLGMPTWICAYDQESGTLVAAELSDDVPIYCEGTSWTIRWGELPASCQDAAAVR